MKSKLLAPSVVLGSQTPRLSSFTPGVRSLGEDVSLYAEVSELNLFEWQDNVLDMSMQVDASGRWTARKVCLIVARQNGKGSILTARCIYGLFVLGEQIIHTAHEFKTASDAYYRIRGHIMARPKLEAQVKRWSSQYGLESIELKSGAKLKFLARTKGSGRGLKSDLLILDEAYELTEPQLNALTPTQQTSGNPQTWYTSSAVDQDLQPNGEILARQRLRGLAGDPRIAFAEWSAEPGDDRTSIEAAAKANPSLGLLIDWQTIEDARDELSAKSFDVEILSIGDWPNVSSRKTVIDMNAWADMAESKPVVSGPISLAFDMTPDQRWVTIAAATYTAAGQIRMEVGYHEAPNGAAVRKILKLIDKWDPGCLLTRHDSPAKSLIPDLKLGGIEPELVPAGDYAQACVGFYNDAVNGMLSHADDPRLTDALRGAAKRELSGGAWVWDQKASGAVLSPLDTATLARHGLVTLCVVEPPPAAPDYDEIANSAEEFDALSAAF